jgi:4-hydroxy-tetrahydrodipicolinate synthase
MVRAGLQNDFKKAKMLNDTLIEVYHLLFSENNPAGIKAFLYELGLIKNILRLPLVPLSDEIQKKVHKFLNK